MVVLNYLNEIWKDISGFEGQYQGSNFGRIKSLKFGKEKILKIMKNRDGYAEVALYKNGKAKRFLVHRLVWLAFHGEIPEGMEINHIDENPQNNRLENLELVTHKENLNWGTRNQRASKALKNSKKAKSVFQYNLEGQLIKEFPSTREVERELGLNQGYISLCCNGKRKSAYGYIWSFLKKKEVFN